jgi:integrase
MNTYHSGFADLIQMFVDNRKASGLGYEQYGYDLHLFDKFCVMNYPPLATLCQEMVDDWCAKRDTELNRTRNTRIRSLRTFILFLQKRGLTDISIPELLKPEPRNYIPYAFTTETLQRFFAVCDNLPGNRPDQLIKKMVCPVLFRLLYSSGIRTTEARLLQRKDVDLEHGVLDIQKSKGYDQHYVALHETMTSLLKRYDRAIEQLQPNRSWFFESPNGDGYTYQWLYCTFRKIWDKANGCGSKAVAYDLRHNYAIENINRWKEDGFEFSNKLFYLSKSMGHRKIASTLYYYSIVPRLADTIQRQTETSFNLMVPEVEYEEDK